MRVFLPAGILKNYYYYFSVLFCVRKAKLQTLTLGGNWGEEAAGHEQLDFFIVINTLPTF